MSYLPWLASLLSVGGLFLNARKRCACWPVWLVSNALWAWHTYRIQEWAALATWGVFSLFNLYGWWAWAHPGKDKP